MNRVRCGHWRGSIAALMLLCVVAVVNAQRAEPVHRIGFLGMSSNMQAKWFAIVRDELRNQGYIEGVNLVIETRWAEGDFNRLPALAAELVALKPEVVMTAAPPSVRAVQAATTTIPIVMVVHDPVGMGFVSSLAHPGGNITGVAFQDSELSTKRLDLLRSVVPNLSRLAVVWNRAGGGEDTPKVVERAAESLGIKTRVFEVFGPKEITAAVAEARAWGAQGLAQLASPVITFNQQVFLDALAANRMPATCEMRRYVEAGCLMTYSADLGAQFRSMAVLAARILKGAKPSELPIVQPREFEFVINETTAKTLGLTISPTVRLQITDAVK